MSLISLRNINIFFDGPKILDDVSFEIQKGQRICVLGRNGAGKSTLMRIINGDVKPDSGEVVVSPGLKVSYLTQDVPENITGSVFDVVAGGAGRIGEALAEYHRELANPTDNELLHKHQHDLTENDGWQIEAVIHKVLDQVQVQPELEFSSLSGGLRRRVFLARALVKEPDILLLDEPTNHLDLESIKWLEDFLLKARLTVMFVTHDRRLLKKLATRIIEIDRGRIIDWSCDYTTFLERKQGVLDNEEKANTEFDKKLAQEEIWIRQGVKARRTRAEGRVNALKKMREERRKRRSRTGNVSMVISDGGRSGDKVLEAENISFSYDVNQIIPSPFKIGGSKSLLPHWDGSRGAVPEGGDEGEICSKPPAPSPQSSPLEGEEEKRILIKDFTFTLMRGDRIGIIGPNGCGKTTLLNLLLGKLSPQTGQVEPGANVKPLYFDQLRKGIDSERTVWENVAETNDSVFINGKPRHVISYLQDFLFTSERARTKVKFLSGGERHRLLLARLFTMPSNLLVFDEPTNDLDTETLELLEEVLLQYEGTLIVVSHDREFLNNVVTSALIFGKEGKLNEYIGGYDDWERQLAASEEPQKSEPETKKEVLVPPPAPKGPRKMSMKEKKELEGIPVVLETLESEQRAIHAGLADLKQCQKPGFVAQSKARLSELEAELAKVFARWEELETLSKSQG